MAAALAAAPRPGAGLVLCGDLSADRGSGSVPAFLAAHLGAAQALGLVAVELGAAGHAHRACAASTAAGASGCG